jgi:hypothetical protein
MNRRIKNLAALLLLLLQFQFNPAGAGDPSFFLLILVLPFLPPSFVFPYEYWLGSFYLPALVGGV